MRRGLLLLGLGACQFTVGSPGAGPVDAPSELVDGDGPGDGPQARVRAIDLDDGMVAGGPHPDFPLLVAIAAPWIRARAHGGDVTRDDGFDLHFTADVAGTTLLAHELEAYDATAGSVLAWVKVPSLSTSTVVYIHYGDPAATTDPQDVPGTWSGGYELVVHLGVGVVDATGKTNTFDVVTSGVPAAQIERGHDFDGVDDRIVAGSATAIDNVFAGGGTAEGWFFADGYGEGGFGRLFDKGHTNGWSMAINNGNATRTLAFVHGANTQFGEWNGPSSAVSLGAWHHAAVVYDNGSPANNPTMYVDGVALQGIDELVTPSGSARSDATFDLLLGNRVGGDRTFDGVLDELRLSSVVRSADWLLTQYRNQRQPSAFYAISEQL